MRLTSVTFFSTPYLSPLDLYLEQRGKNMLFLSRRQVSGLALLPVGGFHLYTHNLGKEYTVDRHHRVLRKKKMAGKKDLRMKKFMGNSETNQRKEINSQENS